MPTPAVDRFPQRLAQPRSPYNTTARSPQWVEVLVDCPGTQGVYTYRLTSELAVELGDILSVPFGASQVGAIAVRVTDRLPEGLDEAKVREVEEVIARGFFAPGYWQLIERVAAYYRVPLMQAIRVALPPGLLGRSQRRVRLNRDAIPPGAEVFISNPARQVLDFLERSRSGNYTWQYLQRQVRGGDRALRELLKRGWIDSYLEAPRTAKPKRQQAIALAISSGIADLDLTPRQQELLTLLQRRGGEMWLSDLLRTARTSRGTVEALVQAGCVVVEDREILRTASGLAVEGDAPKTLTDAQANALDTINRQRDYTQILLHGVTGSGKTEVYLQAIAPVLQRGESALVLVPEIGLTPQLTDRFRARFGDRVCVYHSALSDGERYDTWRQMLGAQAQVVIGTRSAIFTPLPNVGLIVLDEEHDSSFKQDRRAPCYHARTVARWRAEIAECPLVLGSATPSLDSWIETTSDRPQTAYLSLPERIYARPMPPVQVVDMRSELQQGNRSIFSRSLREAIAQLQENNRQGLLFINRRGHSTFVSCRSCGYVIECPHCDVSLSYHYTHEGASQLLRCHYCGYSQLHPQQCPECDSPYLKFFGSGTQRVMRELAREFPQLRTLRFDSDTTRTKGAHRSLLTQFANREVDLLVGTQMLTKGLDLPSVGLVGVVAADGLLHLSDYRAAERAFQTFTQVAGRAGRGDDPGQVIVQTYTPDHPVIEAVRRHEYEPFTQAELEQREALNYPPYGKLILLRLSGLDEMEVQQVAQEFAAQLEPEDEETAGYELLGPAPAPVKRVARRFRWHILLKLEETEVQLPDLEGLRSRCPRHISLTIDVDPLNLG